MLHRTLYLAILFLSFSFIVIAQDSDGDGIDDYIDLDSDNDGILDINECVIPIADYSFENTIFYGLSPEWISTGSAGSHNLEASNYLAAAEGNQFLFINSFGGSVSVTLDQFSKTYEEGRYTLVVAIGDGIFDRLDRNDNENILEIGYGSDGASFTPLNSVTIDGSATLPGTWTDAEVSVDITAPSPALGQGILIRVTHVASAVPVGTNTARSDVGNYDNFRIYKDTDMDGLSDCIDADSDDDTNSSGCFDGLEAGHDIDPLTGQVLYSSINADGTIVPLNTAYTGTTYAVLSSNIETCAFDYFDNDGDGVTDAVDLDDDNDGITDAYDCDIPLANSGFENFSIPENFIEDWRFINIDGLPDSNAGLEDPANIGDGTNYNSAEEGNTYAYINGNASLTLNTIYGTFEEGGYTFELSLGDGSDINSRFRNDGQTTIQIGYHDGDFNNFTPITGATRVIGSWETPNGTWSRFKVTGEVFDGDAALGQAISVRIEHTANNDLRQWQGNYDALTFYRDSDADGISNCFELDSDDDGCPDAAEMGYIINGDNTIQRTGEFADGTVDTAQFLLGTRPAVLDDAISGCDIADLDNDGIEDGDRFYYGPGNSQEYDFDLDNDNDGISDYEEGCRLTDGNARGLYNFEFSINSFFFPLPETTTVNYWVTSGTGWGLHLLQFDETVYAPNYETDGTLLRDIPDNNADQPGTFFNDTYALLNGTASMVQNIASTFVQSDAPMIEEGHYILTIAIGDGVDYIDQGRNDGTSTIELGYDDGSGFTTLGTPLVVEGYETKNGMWTDFTMDPVEATPASLGQRLLVRISHEAGFPNQQQGNYDYIRIDFDYDGDGIPDCNDPDSDNDGCTDATEAGFTNDDLDNFVGNGVPAVDGDGLVTGTDGYTTPVSANVRSFSLPAVIDTQLTDPTAVCEGEDAIFTVVASRPAPNTNIVYEWYESTDGGTTFVLLTDVAPYSGTVTTELTIAGVTIAQDTYQYRVRVMGDDNLCFEESTATLNVTAGPTAITPVAVTAAICEGEDAEFTITGTTGDIITYSFDGGTTPLTITIGATGTETVTSTAAIADVTMEISSIESATCTLNLVPVTSATVIVNTVPELEPTTTATCAADLATYDVDIVLNIGNITNVSEGTLTGTTVTGIIAGNDLVITVDNNGCIRDLTLTAPDCSCPVIDNPVNANNPSICFGAVTPDVSVDLGTNGNTINWYDASTAGTLLSSGTTYTTGETAVGTYTYYAEAIETASGCTSNRIPVTLVINPMPVADTSLDINECALYTLPALSANNFYYTGPNATGTNLAEGTDVSTSQTIYIYSESGTTPNCFDENSFDVTISETPVINLLSATCSTDLNTYSVQFSNSSTTALITSSAGTVSGNSVIDIPSSTGSITITADNNGCIATLTVIAPDCSCPIIDDATNPINANTCEGSSNASLQVSLGSNGDTINWYTTATGGTSIANGLTFTPTDSAIGTYTYYAEVSDNITGCISDNRIAVTLTIEQIPVADTLSDVEGCEFFVLPNLSNNNNYYTGANGTGQLLAEGSQVNQNQTIYIFAQSPNNLDCSSESEFEVTILEEPIIDLPYEVSICSNANGVTTSVPIGVDLGTNYIYDWTPNNDTNGDGIEEAIFNVTQAGEYSLRIYTIGNSINCGGSLEYVVNVTEAPLPQDIEIEITSEGFELNSGNRVRAIINNDIFAYTNFEYSLDDPDGPYQTDNFFQNVVGGLHTIFVRSIGSCGTTLESDPFLIVNYPTYFSPNGDGSNDTWFPLGLADPNLTTNVVAEIYDRHGKLVHYLDPFGAGWDGTYNGESLPESDYWFVIEYTDAIDDNRNIQFKGHFSLIR
ncbi:T9SS type B sorting domain-containing protein [Maribacter aquivivus]|uniref:T9SS type B sorting domain-containing protein n=1 Tax=Maribacter aquivivus TaxID=228958 RepID=UPI0024947064|nr:T9SS type B sorting domain-containing protein [Maribacter aquivivus]